MLALKFWFMLDLIYWLLYNQTLLNVTLMIIKKILLKSKELLECYFVTNILNHTPALYTYKQFGSYFNGIKDPYRKILCYHWRLGSDIKVLRLMFWFKDLVWDNKFIRQRIMLITHHDENVFSFQIYDVASTLFFCGNFLSFGQTCFQKILFFQIFLFF